MEARSETDVGEKNHSSFNENTRNAEVLSFAHHYFTPPLGHTKLPSQPPSKPTGVSGASVCTAETG